MWNIGIMARLTDRPGSTSHMSRTLEKAAIRFEVVSITPLGRPVVPEVYSW